MADTHPHRSRSAKFRLPSTVSDVLPWKGTAMSDAATGFYVMLFIVLMGLANIPAKIASDKGYNYTAFYLFGLALFIPALIVSLLIQDKNKRDKADSDNTADELLKYKQLLDAEAISLNEYLAVKEKLLSDKLPAHFEDKAPRHSRYSIVNNAGEIRKTTQNLSTAALVLAAICLVFTNGFDLIFSLPVDPNRAPEVPAFAQSAFCSMASGVLFLLAIRKKEPLAALAGMAFTLVTDVLWLVGLFGSFITCDTYDVDIFRYAVQTYDIGFSILFFLSILCSTTSALLLYNNYSRWGIDVSAMNLRRSRVSRNSKIRIAAICISMLAVMLLCLHPISCSTASEEQGNAFVAAMRPYLSHLGEETVNGSISMPQELIDKRDEIEFCGVLGTVSHKFNEENSTKISICDWVSNEMVGKGIYAEAVEALRSHYGWDGESGTSEATPEFGSFDFVQWSDAETDGMVTIFIIDGHLHVRWWPGNGAEPDPSISDADVADSSGNSGTSLRNRSYDNEDYAFDSDDDNEHLYDEESGIYGVYDSEDGDGLFAGDNFAMRLNEDGTGVATDGKGNWVADTDGDGEVDSISIDGGNTWL